MRKISFVFGSLLLLPGICCPQSQKTPDPQHISSKEVPTALANTPYTPDDVQALLEVVRSTSPTVQKTRRESALALLSNPAGGAAAALGPSYLALLDDPDPEIKSVAAIATGAMGIKAAIPKLRKILKAVPKHPFDPNQGLDYAEYRAAMGAASGLATLGDQESIPEILSRETISPSWEMLLPKFGAAALPQVVERARSNREAVRNGALKTIASFHDPESLPKLKNLLADKDHAIQTSAVLALVRSKSPSAMSAVRDAYPDLDDEGKSNVAIACIKQCDTVTAMRYVKDFMTNSKQGWSKLLVVMALGNSNKKEAVPFLEGLLKDSDDDLRAQAACQLAGLTGKRYQYAETNWTRSAERNCKYFKGPEK